MKNIFIILFMTLALGLASMFATGALLRSIDKKTSSTQEVKHDAKPDDNPLKALQQTTEETGAQFQLMKKRQHKSQVAGLIGLGVGFASGLMLVTLRDRKKRA